MTASDTPQVGPRAWLRVSNISGQSNGVFETQNVELRSERLVPLYEQSVLAGKAVGSALQIALAAGEETTGLCTVREFAQYMHESGMAKSEMYFESDGKRWNVELHITGATKIEGPNVGIEPTSRRTEG